MGDGLQPGQLLGAVPRGQDTVTQSAEQREVGVRAGAKALLHRVALVPEHVTRGSDTHAEGQVAGLPRTQVPSTPSHVNGVQALGCQRWACSTCDEQMNVGNENSMFTF